MTEAIEAIVSYFSFYVEIKIVHEYQTNRGHMNRLMLLTTTFKFSVCLKNQDDMVLFSSMIYAYSFIIESVEDRLEGLTYVLKLVRAIYQLI